MHAEVSLDYTALTEKCSQMSPLSKNVSVELLQLARRKITWKNHVILEQYRQCTDIIYRPYSTVGNVRGFLPERFQVVRVRSP